MHETYTFTWNIYPYSSFSSLRAKPHTPARSKKLNEERGKGTRWIDFFSFALKESRSGRVSEKEKKSGKKVGRENAELNSNQSLRRICQMAL